MRLRVIAFVVVCQHLHLAFGNVDVTIDELQTQVKELQSDVTDLSKMVENLEKNVVNRNIAEQNLDKAIASVLMNKQEKASMYWRGVVTYLDPSLLNENLKSLIENAYLGSSENFCFVLDFLLKNDLYMGLPMLLKELEEHRELHRGQEFFVLAHLVKSLCGASNEFYNKIPKVVREVLAGPVILKNVDNNGYMLADGGNPSTKVYVELLPSTTTIEDLKNNSRAQWQFSGPENFTELSEGFYIKNMQHDLFFIFNQRPPQGLLKSNSSYNSGPMHSQFRLALVPNAGPDENILRIGVRERIFKKISYFYSREFSKKVKRFDMSRVPMPENEVKTFFWEVTPVNSDLMDNDIEGGEINEKH